jgi:cysteinyl-tRNA synthetase
MTRDVAPEPIRAVADARAVARRARDWATADRLKAEIEAAGWKVVDIGTLYDLVRAAPPDVVEDGVMRYGSSTSVPSRLDDQPIGMASVVVVAGDRSSEVGPLVRGLVGHAPDGTQVVVVANGLAAPDAATLVALDAADPGAPGVVMDVVSTSARLGYAAALNAGIRQAAGPVVVLADGRLVPSGDLVTPLVAVLEDQAVAVAGRWGIVSDDMRRWRAAPDGTRDADAIDGSLLAFRRADYRDRGPLDERFDDPASLDAWWSLVLRDPADDAAAGEPPRRAVQLWDLPVMRPRPEPVPAGTDREADRLARRNAYRLLKRFATRLDLLGSPSGRGVDTEPGDR